MGFPCTGCIPTMADVATYSASDWYLPCSETIAEMDAIKEKRQDANYQKAFEQLDYAIISIW